MKLLLIADDDSFIRHYGQERADVLISCGDLTDEIIKATAVASQCAGIFAVKGNHDSSGPFSPPIIDLHLRLEAFAGVRFGGFNGAWRYKPRGNYLYDQVEVARLLAAFPPVDVFVAHNSPRHVHDRDDEVHIGFEAFRDYIDRVKPRLFLHGHQHLNQETQIGQTRVIGVYGCKQLEL